VAAKRTKGKGRAIESDEDGRSLGLRPIYPAIYAQALFIPAVVKRVDSSDVEMAARRSVNNPGINQGFDLISIRFQYQSRTRKLHFSCLLSSGIRRGFAR
jgi:hypothetical protein